MSAPPVGVATGAPNGQQQQQPNAQGVHTNGQPGGVDAISLSSLKRADPCVCNIIARATQVCGYVFVKQAWEKSGVEGTLFLCERSAAPRHSLIVLNRSSPDNMYEPITDQVDVTIKLPYIFYRTPKGITSLWFYDEREAQLMYDQILKVQTELKQTGAGGQVPPAGNEPMMGLAQQQAPAMPVALAHIFGGGGAAGSPQPHHQQAPAGHHHHELGAAAASLPGGPPAGDVAHLVPGAFSAAQLEMAMKAGGTRAYESQGRRSADMWSTQSVDGSVAASVATQRSNAQLQAAAVGGQQQQQQQQHQHVREPVAHDARSAMLGRLLGLTPQAVDEVANRSHHTDRSMDASRFDQSTASTVGGGAGDDENSLLMMNDSSLLPPTEFGLVHHSQQQQQQHAAGNNNNDNGSSGGGTDGDLKRNYSTIPNVGSQRSSPANELSRLSLSTRGLEPMAAGATAGHSHATDTPTCGGGESNTGAAGGQAPSIAGVAPLTRDQMLQALNYLLQHDAGFITQLHEAYVKCINERMLAATHRSSADRH